jgi:MYXO-CTERM domain-containing protein
MSKTSQFVNVGKQGWGAIWLVCSFFLLSICVPTTSTAQIYLDGNLMELTWSPAQGWYGYNENAIDNADVHSYLLNNYGSIGKATVYGGELWNDIWGDSLSRITIATVYGGELHNFGKITIATVNDGYLRNGAWHREIGIENATLNGGYLSNNGVISRATINGGMYSNNAGTTNEAILNGGYLSNNGGLVNVTINDGRLYTIGTINRATINGGTLVNEVYNNVYLPYDRTENVTMNGGNVLNPGHIDNLTYNAGDYSNSDGSFHSRPTGTIGTLIIAGDATGIDWGSVDHLRFENGGTINLTVTLANAANEMAPFGIQMMNADIAPMTGGLSGFEFSNIQVNQSVDLTNGNIVLTLDNAIAVGTSLSLADLFGIEDIVGTLASVTIGDQTFVDVGSTWAAIYTEEGVWTSGDTVGPAPATLVIMGLGLAGLGLARARRRK